MLKDLHEGAIGGHLGVEAALQLVVPGAQRGSAQRLARGSNRGPLGSGQNNGQGEGRLLLARASQGRTKFRLSSKPPKPPCN